MSLITGAVRRLRSDAGAGALVVVGEAGVGKTRLAGYLDDAAARAGIRVVHGRALPDGLGGSLRPVAEMLLELTRESAAPEDTGLAPYVTVLASLVPHWRFPGWSAPAEPVVVMAEAVLRVLRWATGGAGVTVIWEDLHWADDATLAVIRYLADRLYHVCYRTDTGFTVIDIWADEQSFAAFGETLGPAIQYAGLDARPAVYPVEQVMAQDGTRSGQPGRSTS